MPRPELGPIDPQAAYDPEMAKTLASQRTYGQDIKAGTGFAMDVMAQNRMDKGEADLQQAKAAAIAQGIPFDEQEWRTRQLQGENTASAQDKLEREKLYGSALSEEAGQAGRQASERDVRLQTDLARDTTENAQKIDLYQADISKYSADAAAAAQANQALMSFFSQLTGSLGSMGGSNLSSSYRFG